MADSPISSLPSVDNIEPDDLFVLEHTSNGQRQACKLRGEQVTQYVSRNVVAYNGSIVPSNAAGGANYDPDTQTLTLVLPHGPGFETVVPGASRAATEEEVASLDGTVTTYDLMSEEVRLTNPDSTIPSQKIGEIQVYNGRNGTGLINSVMNVGPTAGTTNVPAEKLFNLIYPVGSIYMSVNSTSPATLFGGSWERIQDSFLLAAGSTYGPGTTGGVASQNITSAGQADIGIYNLVSGSSSYHNAYIQMNDTPVGGTAGTDHLTYNNYTRYINLYRYDSSSPNWANYVGEAGTYADAPATRVTATASNVNNMPPYLAVYVWRRTALAT